MKAFMKLSIRYDLSFQEAALRFADDQIEAACNTDGSRPTLEQEQRCNHSHMMLCDAIDRYVERRVEAVRAAAGAALKEDR